MLVHHFATGLLPKGRQLEGWRAWDVTVFDITTKRPGNEDFVATNSAWTVPGLTLSRVASPANTVSRTKSVIRHNPVDHWVITLSKESMSDVATRGVSFEAAPKTPFILSFGEDIGITRRQQDKRLQLVLPRDSFQAIAPVIDAATGMALTSPGARMLADYILLLEDEGGVAHYIQRRRLSESFTLLCDAENSLSIGAVADMLCFSDASSFSRAFRREFGMSPSDVRAATQAGLPPAPPPKPPLKSVLGPGALTFSDLPARRLLRWPGPTFTKVATNSHAGGNLSALRARAGDRLTNG